MRDHRAALRREGLPEGARTVLDFGPDDEAEGAQVEVVEYLDPVLKKVDLARAAGLTTPTGSW